MKVSLFDALAALFAYTNGTDYIFTIDGCTVADYDPADAEALFQELLPFFAFQSDRFAPPRLECIGWGCREDHDGMPYDGKNTLQFVRNYLPTHEEVAAYAALHGLTDLSIAHQRLSIAILPTCNILQTP